MPHPAKLKTYSLSVTPCLETHAVTLLTPASLGLTYPIKQFKFKLDYIAVELCLGLLNRLFFRYLKLLHVLLQVLVVYISVLLYENRYV